MKKIALVGGYLIDGTGREPLVNSLVLVEGKKITYAGPQANGDKGADQALPELLQMTNEGHIPLICRRFGPRQLRRLFILVFFHQRNSLTCFHPTGLLPSVLLFPPASAASH